MKRTLIYSRNAETGRQSCSASFLLRQLKVFTVVSLSVNDLESALSIDLGVTNTS